MKHRTLGRRASHRLTVPPLSGGVELSSPPHLIADDRLSDAINLWWRQGRLCTRPALRESGTLTGIPDALTATPLYRRTLLHGGSGDTYHTVLANEDGSLVAAHHVLPNVTGVLAVAAGRDITADDRVEALLYADGRRRAVYGLTDTGGLRLLSPYVPTVLAAARPTKDAARADNGAYTEPFNRLTNEFHCRFTSDGEGLYYWLPETVTLDHDYAVTVRHTDVAGTVITHTLDYRDSDGLWKERLDEAAPPVDELALCYDPDRRCFWFVHAHGGGVAPAGMATVSGNVQLTATRADTEGGERLFGMRFGTWFGSRLFLSGNDTCRNLILWSALGDALYFPENNYAYVGDADSAVTAFGKQSDLLVIFKERETYAAQYRAGSGYTAEELLDGAVTDTEVAAATFPITQIHPAVGCDCPETLCLCGERLVWATTEGHVYVLVSGGTYDARRIRTVSFPVEAELCRAPHAVCRTAAAVEGQYVLLLDRIAYVLDTRSSGFAGSGGTVAWQTWLMPPVAASERLVRVGNTALLVSQSDSTVYGHRFDPDAACDRLPTVVGGVLRGFRDAPIACELATKRYDLGDSAVYKQVCGVTLWITGETGERVTVSLHDGTAERSVGTLPLCGGEPSATLPRYLPFHAPRLRYCGIHLRSTGRMAVEGMEITFRGQGEGQV